MQIDFSFETKYGVYSDCIHLTDEEYSVLSEYDIEEIKTERLNNWISIIENPNPVVEIENPSPALE